MTDQERTDTASTAQQCHNEAAMARFVAEETSNNDLLSIADALEAEGNDLDDSVAAGGL